MAWKVITFLAIFALSEARPPTSEQRVKIENWLSHIGSHEPEHHEVYASAYPSYEFTYEVSDPHTHDFKGHHEQRKGDDVKGYYWLIQPDGLKRTVKYHADKHSGFKAHVEYTKHWEGEHKKHESRQEEANEDENNSGENENSEENENGQEDESTNNESEAEGESENNESSVGAGEERETEESENQENEQNEQRGNWKHGHHLSRGNHGRRDNDQKSHDHKLKATVGIWQPNHWSKRHRNEESRQVRAEERNDNNGENENRGHGKGSGRRGNNGKTEERRQESQNNENSKRNGGNKEEQRNEGNENAESRIENNHKGESIKSEYHVIIHHPKH